MIKLFLEDVYTLSGIPRYTYVVPQEYIQLKVAMRTPGRGVVIEGPSGIGKTTAVFKVVEELGEDRNCIVLSSRKAKDLELIKEIAYNDDSGIGTIIIDDFHRLDDIIKNKIANKMKVLADEESKTDKIVIIGINKAGDSLVRFSPDLNNRIDTIHFETNSNDKIRELIEKGEQALNIQINNKDFIIENSYGSFHIAQLLCERTCIQQGIIESCNEMTVIDCQYSVVLENIVEEFSRIYSTVTKTFATGPRLRREGRAPYLHILIWLAKSNDWSLQLTTALAHHPRQRAGVGQIMDKGYLADFIRSHVEFADIIHYDDTTKILSIEDPKFVFYLRNILWSKFAEQIGYLKIDIESNYDVALSFAGTDRKFAKLLYDKLCDYELAVFYDENEQARILGENVEDYLYPIYKSEAIYIIPLMGLDYPKRIWTKFESEAFKTRFGKNSIIPIWFNNVDISMFDESRKYGGITFDPESDVEIQIERMAGLISEKVGHYKTGSK